VTQNYDFDMTYKLIRQG